MEYCSALKRNKILTAWINPESIMPSEKSRHACEVSVHGYAVGHCSPPGSPVHGVLQTRILEWGPCAPPGDLPEPGLEPVSPEASALQADSLLLSHWRSPVKCLD